MSALTDHPIDNQQPGRSFAPAPLLGSSLPVFRSNLSQEDREAKRVMLRRQIQHLVTAPREQQIFITCCACSQRAVVWMMYRCLYCGLFYCKSCAEIHFGQRKPTFDEDLPNK